MQAGHSSKPAPPYQAGMQAAAGAPGPLLHSTLDLTLVQLASSQLDTGHCGTQGCIPWAMVHGSISHAGTISAWGYSPVGTCLTGVAAGEVWVQDRKLGKLEL